MKKLNKLPQDSSSPQVSSIQHQTTLFKATNSRYVSFPGSRRMPCPRPQTTSKRSGVAIGWIAVSWWWRGESEGVVKQGEWSLLYVKSVLHGKGSIDSAGVSCQKFKSICRSKSIQSMAWKGLDVLIVLVVADYVSRSKFLSRVVHKTNSHVDIHFGVDVPRARMQIGGVLCLPWRGSVHSSLCRELCCPVHIKLTTSTISPCTWLLLSSRRWSTSTWWNIKDQG